MRFFLLTVLVCLNLVGPVQGQFGLNGGVQLASLHDQESSSNDFENARIGFRVGGFYEHTFKKGWGFHAELNYSLAGLKSEDARLDMHYLSIPLLAYYAPVKKLKVYLGPEINLLMGSGSQLKAFGDTFNKFDPGITAGIEFRASEKIGIALRNYFGLRFNTKFKPGAYYPIDGNDPTIIKEEIKMDRNNVLQLGINYYLLK